MKTIENFIEETINDYFGDDEDNHAGDMTMLSEGIKLGVEFAQRWIPVEEELPTINEYGFTEELLTKLGSLIVIQKGFKNNKGYFMWCDEPCTHFRQIELK